MTLRPGWLKRQMDLVASDIATWPAWMRGESGLEEMSKDTKKTAPLPSMGELAGINAELANKILHHSEARNAVVSVLKGEVSPPTLTLVFPSDGVIEVETFEFQLTDMPQELVDTILECIITHIEATTFELWPRVHEVAQAAAARIAQLKHDTSKQSNKQSEPVIKFPGDKVQPGENLES